MNTLISRSKPAPYHHGDLRRALLDTANAILSETGRWDFSLREVARRAGVSHTAAYRHFVDKEAMIAAIAITGYEALHTHSAAAVKGTSNAAETLQALGEAHIEFGVRNPALYRLMFGQALPGIDGLPPAVMAAVEVARAMLRDVILAGASSGVFAVDPDDPAEVKVAVVTAWSLVHGFTLLTIDQVIRRETGQDVIKDLAAMVTRRCITGLRSQR